MKVTLIAGTTLLEDTWPDSNEMVEDTGWGPYAEDSALDALAEFSGRACYQSWNRPNPKTATNEGYLANILGMGHESVLEHASATFYIEGVSRALTHELIRHRHLSFSELSQRYVNVENTESVVPPALAELWYERLPINEWEDITVGDEFTVLNKQASESYKELVRGARNHGLSRKKAREAARAVLPNATETKIVVTGNMRAWRDVLKKRHHVAADAEIQALAKELLKQLKGIAPNSFQDIPDEPYGSE